jgi:hypothetical protein
VPTGTPDLLLTLTNSHTITDPPFHPCVRFVLTSPPERTKLQPSTQTKPLCAIKSALVRPTRWAFHANRIPLRSLSKQTQCSPTSYSSSISAGPSPSTICATRLALHYRPTVRRRARGRCRRALSRFGRDEYRRYGRWRVDVRSCTTHTALVPRLFRLYDPRHFPLRLATGPHRDAPAHIREQ